MGSAKQMTEVKRFLKEKVRTDIVAEYDQLIDELPDDVKSFKEAEQVLRRGTIGIACKLLQCWVEVAEKKLDVPKCPKCKINMRHRGLRECTIVTTIGEVTYRRPRYICKKCGQSIYPHDATARFLTHGVSQSLAQVIARMGADRPFEQAAEYLAEDYYLHLSNQTVRKVAEDAGAHIVRAEDARREAIQARTPEERVHTLQCDKDTTYDIGVVTCDGAMVHTREEPAYLGPNPDAKPDWHEVRVGNASVGNLPANPKKPSGGKRGHDFRMEVVNTNTFARFESVEDVGNDLFLRAVAAGFFNARLRCFISDGASWIRNMAEEHFSDAILILDWYHAMEHVGDLSNEVFGRGTDESHRWTKQRENELWDGRVGAVLHAMKALHSRENLTESARKELDKTITYISNNRDRMRYPQYRELGLPIGSGRIEGLCKSLVGSRCKLSGMRGWTIRGSEGILRIRAARRDGNYKEIWNQHFTPV
jgi:hypothetical protein